MGMNPTESADMLKLCEEALKEAKWEIERIPGASRSMRKITKRNQKASFSRIVSLRSSRDTCLSFTRNVEDTGWDTLSDPDLHAVVLATVDDKDHPTCIRVFMFEAADLRVRFDKAYQDRKDQGYAVGPKRGVWLPLFKPDTGFVGHSGYGAGIGVEPLAVFPLEIEEDEEGQEPTAQEGLTIAEAKQGLAAHLGVSPECIQITISA